jgi:nucleotide-binding universal stress UspA family protein
MSVAQPIIVVGYDASPLSDRALEYAMDRVRSGSLCIIHAWEAPRALRGTEVYPVLAAASLARAEALIDELPARHPRLDGVAWRAHVAEGHPADCLAAAAREVAAAGIVVGGRGHGHVRSAFGSTAHALLHQAPCPVTVVPADASSSAVA